MSVSDAVEDAISGLPVADRSSWMVAVVRTLAEGLDAEPNAALARELRSTMAVLTANLSAPVEVDAVDEIAAARDRRRAAGS